MNPLTDALRLPAVLWRYRELVAAFVRRELKARIEGSLLGRIWPVLQPLALYAIYFLVFVKILKIGFSDAMAPHGTTELDRGWRSTFYLITGILPWTALAETLGRGTSVVLENANLIKKIAFPSELLAVYQVIVYHVYFLVGFVVLLALELAVNGSLPVALVWFPVVLVVQMMLITGLTMLLSAANVFVRDVAQAVPTFLVFWMFTTPVFWDLSMVAGNPNAAQGAPYDFVTTVGSAMQYNPMAILLSCYRSIFSYGHAEFPLRGFLRLTATAAVVLWLGYAYFLRSKGRFADEV